jgi:prolyl-tRNA editing enzyme YbaK/EbsC (Cys-tRNA(Pro) deacylase)
MRGRSIDRVSQAALDAGLDIEIVEMPASTRTADETAAACGCSVTQIVKSLVFRKSGTQELVLLLVAGNRTVDLEIAGRAIGIGLDRADPKLVREVSGFSIGGVSPLGHKMPLPVFMDPSLLNYRIVWAAAGAPNAVFSVDPSKLRDSIAAEMLPPDACRI